MAAVLKNSPESKSSQLFPDLADPKKDLVVVFFVVSNGSNISTTAPVKLLASALQIIKLIMFELNAAPEDTLVPFAVK
jgi:hypothetical protein